ncbi:MAG TPA: penicillin-binding transpeptidase domain-containing protein [Bryobacteraceae bacterium]|nr:penicillin-binding transpeptidase domain-containing protein [Bryobacteraceae bacterium]
MHEHRLPGIVRIAILFALIISLYVPGLMATTTKARKRRARTLAHPALVRTTAVAPRKTLPATRAALVKPAPAVLTGVVRGGPWTEPTFADSTEGDYVDGDDLDVRRAAVEALGRYNGSVVVVDPLSGRILSIVNQKLALGNGYQPCSTIKVSVALAALSEKVIAPDTKLRLGGARMDLTYALAHSNNYFFATLGQKLGFERISYYAHLFGYGEKAGLNIASEQPGRFPSAPPANGGVGMLSSFGEEIDQTPLQLAALISAVANGGTLYYLQYPRTPQEAATFVPRVKRRLDIQEAIQEIKPGMRGAVDFGTAHRARQEEPLAGKTGTCSENHAHLGWFGSFNDVGNRKLVVVVLLTGGRGVSGPVASEIAGDFYRHLDQTNYFASAVPLTPAALVSSQICCRQ